MSFKISKITINPTRTINLGDYNSTKLDAGVEIVFDKPVATDSKEIEKAFVEARKIVKEEMIKQWEPYQKMLEEKKKNRTKTEPVTLGSRK